MSQAFFIVMTGGFATGMPRRRVRWYGGLAPGTNDARIM
jgi:hypothetical protein